MTPWTAPSATDPIRAAVTVPGSKSVTNRALLLAALADGSSTVRRPLRARDTLLMAGGLRALGVGVDELGDDWLVTPARFTGDADIDCGLSGTVMRFLLAAAPLAEGVVRLDGDAAARVRPVANLAGALRDLGATVDGDHLPLEVSGTGGLRGGEVTLDASASSQFVSALLLAGCRYDKGVTVRHAGPPLPSAPYVRMTLAMLGTAGVQVQGAGADTWVVHPGTPSARDVTVEPDLVNAVPFLAAAVATGGEVHVEGWHPASLQAGEEMRAVLERVGGAASFTPAGIAVRGDGVHGADLDLHDVSELVPTVAALATFADGPTRIRGVAHIRGHETDRIAALASEINGLGGDVEETADGLEIRPAAVRPGTFHTHGDHRMATAGALLGLRVPGIVLDDVSVTDKTLPDFATRWQAMLDGGQAG
ncbi:MAG: 3-phosphoshikimate 1-carboxyvinyltransferase [Streptosporangiales bacterium]